MKQLSTITLTILLTLMSTTLMAQSRHDQRKQEKEYKWVKEHQEDIVPHPDSLPLHPDARKQAPHTTAEIGTMHRPTNIDKALASQIAQAIGEAESGAATFRGLKANTITDAARLAPFFKKLRSGRQVARVVHVGDSHIRGHVYSQQTRAVLESVFGDAAIKQRRVTYSTSGFLEESGRPGLVYQTKGINGATCKTYLPTERIDEIAALKPDLIILSFGTNEAHNTNYSEADHTRLLDQLTSLLKARCPQACFLLTTSPGSYQSGKKNPRTQRVAANTVAYASSHGMASWDMFNILGGDPYILTNWQSRNMMAKDRVHFTNSGYTIMGKMLAAAMLKAYGKEQ